VILFILQAAHTLVARNFENILDKFLSAATPLVPDGCHKHIQTFCTLWVRKITNAGLQEAIQSLQELQCSKSAEKGGGNLP